MSLNSYTLHNEKTVVYLLRICFSSRVLRLCKYTFANGSESVYESYRFILVQHRMISVEAALDKALISCGRQVTQLTQLNVIALHEVEVDQIEVFQVATEYHL